MENQAEIAQIVGSIAGSLGLLMWLTLVYQIKLNLSGQKGSTVVAAAIVINCVAWVSYGLLKMPPDWPIVVSNVPGILLGAIAAYTSK